MITRRGFLSAILAAGAAPYVMSGGVGRGVLMPVKEVKVATDDEIRAVIDNVANYFYSDYQRAYTDALIYGIGYMQNGQRIIANEILTLN